MQTIFRDNLNNVFSYRLRGHDEEYDVYLNGIYDIHESGKIEGPNGIITNSAIHAAVMKHCKGE